MRRLAALAAILAVGLSLSACGESSSPSAKLPHALRTYVQSMFIGNSKSHVVNKVEVYGPGSRADLVKADSGSVVRESASEKRMRFYLIVAHGHFADYASSPGGRTLPPGTIATYVWSAQEKTTDFGVGNRVGPGVSRLHRIAVITRS